MPADTMPPDSLIMPPPPPPLPRNKQASSPATENSCNIPIVSPVRASLFEPRIATVSKKTQQRERKERQLASLVAARRLALPRARRRAGSRCPSSSHREIGKARLARRRGRSGSRQSSEVGRQNLPLTRRRRGLQRQPWSADLASVLQARR